MNHKDMYKLFIMNDEVFNGYFHIMVPMYKGDLLHIRKYFRDEMVWMGMTLVPREYEDVDKLILKLIPILKAARKYQGYGLPRREVSV